MKWVAATLVGDEHGRNAGAAVIVNLDTFHYMEPYDVGTMIWYAQNCVHVRESIHDLLGELRNMNASVGG